jgi:hypothetical protein
MHLFLEKVELEFRRLGATAAHTCQKGAVQTCRSCRYLALADECANRARK